jgi:hypothetical protein
MGRPGLEPGTNPESFRGCLIKWRIAGWKSQVVDSFSVLVGVQAHALHLSKALFLPPPTSVLRRSAVWCDCCHACAQQSDDPDFLWRRCNIGVRRARCKPKPWKKCGSAGTRTRNQRLKRALLYRLSYRPVKLQFVTAARFFNLEPTPKAFGAALPIELPTRAG